ncbi:MAG: hypothetical protein ACK4PR_02300, partial [Gammaproteobacteria bacterium]
TPDNTDVYLVGHGVIGREIANHLMDKDYFTTISNSDPTVMERYAVNRSTWSNSLIDLLVKANKSRKKNSILIIGASGNDVSRDIDFSIWDELKRNILIISVSSEDEEVKTLLRSLQKIVENATETRHSATILNYHAAQKAVLQIPRIDATQLVPDVLGDIYYKNAVNGSIQILRGGTPYNFDNKIEPVALRKIDLTITLLAIGLIKAKLLAQSPEIKLPLNIQFDPAMQVGIVDTWINQIGRANVNIPDTVLGRFLTLEQLDWIDAASQGEFVNTPVLYDLFAMDKSMHSFAPGQ